VSTSIGIPTGRTGGGGFRVTGMDRTGGNLIMDRGRGQTEAVLSGVEGAERDTD